MTATKPYKVSRKKKEERRKKLRPMPRLAFPPQQLSAGCDCSKVRE